MSHSFNSSHFCALFNTFSGIFANMGLIFIIGNYSRLELGQYKYLMITFATFNIIYPLFHLILMPGIHVVEYAFTFYVVSPFSAYISQSTGQWMILYWTVLYNKQILLIVFHFTYRYIVVCQPNLIAQFKKWPIRALLGVYIMIDLGLWSWFFETQSWALRENRWILKQDFMDYYKMDADTTSILGPLYRYNDTNGITGFRPYNLLCTSVCMSLLFYKFLLMLWFTNRIQRTFKESRMSQKTKKLQMELLKALIAQTICPFLMEGTPCFIIHFSAFNGIYLGMCGFYCKKMNDNKLVLQAAMLYDFKQGKTHAESHRSLVKAFGDDYISGINTIIFYVENPNTLQVLITIIRGSYTLIPASMYPLMDAISMTYFIQDYRRAFTSIIFHQKLPLRRTKIFASKDRVETTRSMAVKPIVQIRIFNLEPP